MRTLVLTALLGATVSLLWPSGEAKAWYDAYGRWHPNYYRPYYAPPPPPYVYYRPVPRHWVPPHYDPWGRWIPGHWV